MIKEYFENKYYQMHKTSVAVVEVSYIALVGTYYFLFFGNDSTDLK